MWLAERRTLTATSFLFWVLAMGAPAQEPSPEASSQEARPQEAPPQPPPPRETPPREPESRSGQGEPPKPASQQTPESSPVPVGPPPPPGWKEPQPRLEYPTVDPPAPGAGQAPPVVAPAEDEGGAAPDPAGEAGPPAGGDGLEAEATSPAAAEPSPPASAAAAPALPPFAPAYRSLAGSSDLLQVLARAMPGLCGLFEVGRELDGRPVQALQLGAPGPVPLERRPTIFLIGGLDGVSLAGSEAVLATVHHLLANPSRLPEGVAFVAIPWASPQGLEGTLSGRSVDGRNLRPVDEDGDGRVDEDGPDDLDGDGQIVSMLVPGQGAPWVRGEDPRFLAPARPGDQPTFALTQEGGDDDGDGRFNEDPPGGVVLDRNFPVNRTGSWREHLCGPWPMSEPLARSYADLVLARRTVAVVLLQGSHGLLAAPGGLDVGEGLALPLPDDLPVYRRLTEWFARSTGRVQSDAVTLARARGHIAPGSVLDWLYVVPGALAVELAPWGPRVELGRQVTARDARFGGEASEPAARDGELPRLPLPMEARREWGPWVDNVLGGLGFMSWQPVQLPGGGEGLVGGWEPRTVRNPPEATLERALQGVPEFVATLAAALPRLEVVDLAHRSRGEVHRVSARVRNGGQLPSSLDRGLALGEPDGVLVELALPAGAELLAGEARVVLPRLWSEEVSREVSWLVLAAQGTSATVSVSSAWCLPKSTRVRL